MRMWHTKSFPMILCLKKTKLWSRSISYGLPELCPFTFQIIIASDKKNIIIELLHSNWIVIDTNLRHDLHMDIHFTPYKKKHLLEFVKSMQRNFIWIFQIIEWIIAHEDITPRFRTFLPMEGDYRAVSQCM